MCITLIGYRLSRNTAALIYGFASLDKSMWMVDSGPSELVKCRGTQWPCPVCHALSIIMMGSGRQVRKCGKGELGYAESVDMAGIAQLSKGCEAA